MNNAICTEDQHTYTADEFSKLPSGELNRKRNLLLCSECKNKAFYRKRARNGRGACFGAQHEEGCQQSTSDGDNVVAGSGEDKDELANTGERIVLDLNFGSPNPEVHIDGDPDAPRRPRGGRHIGGDGSRNAVSHRRLGPILRDLVDAPNFRYSRQIVEIPEKPEMSVADFFVELTDVTRQYEGQYRGYWGNISSVVPAGDGDVWLNSGRKNQVSFKLAEQDHRTIIKRYRLKEITDLAGRYILVLDTVRIGRSGKLICFIQDTNLVAIY